MQCQGLIEGGENLIEKYVYICSLGESATRMEQLAKEMENRLKIRRRKIVDDPGWKKKEKSLVMVYLS